MHFEYVATAGLLARLSHHQLLCLHELRARGQESVLRIDQHAQSVCVLRLLLSLLDPLGQKLGLEEGRVLETPSICDDQGRALHFCEALEHRVERDFICGRVAILFCVLEPANNLLKFLVE